MKTTPRENLLRTLRRQGFETVPIDPRGFCPAQVEGFRKRFGHENIVEFFNAPYRYIGMPLRPTFSEGRALYKREILPDNVDFDPFGVARSRQDECLHLTRMHYPLKGEETTLEEIRSYPLPELAPHAVETMRREVESLHAAGLASMAPIGTTLWERSWYIRSMEDLMADMMGDDERASLLLDRVAGAATQRMQAAARAGVDLVHLGDDIGMQSSPMMAPEFWEKWLKPRLRDVIAAGREINPRLMVFYHSCGYVMPFIEGLIEIGVDILNPVQPESMAFDEVHARFGGRLSFWSTVGTQTTLPYGSPEAVKEAVWSNLRTCGEKGGIVIGPTHMVEPEVPWENLVALKEACESFSASVIQ
jgi:uroporphyrinogen decarboxylase